MSTNTFDARGELEVGSRRFEIFRLDALQRHFDVARLPFSLKVLLENLLRTEGNGVVRAADIEALATWDAQAEPSTGIVHQVNLEYLARVVFVDEATGRAYPDTLVGTDSHTTMVNGLGVLGWGVGGIEAEAAMLGQPMSMLIPQVIGVRLYGQLPEGATATDLVLTVAERLREKGVVGTFVEFYGAGLASLPLADRATIGNMSPEFGSTCAIFPIDAETVRYLEFTGRPKEQIELVEAYARKQRLWHDADSEEPIYSDKVALDLGEVVPSLAGPKRPQDRISLTDAQRAFRAALEGFVPPYDCHDEASAASFPSSDPPASSVPGHADLTRASASAHSPGSQDRVAEGWTAATETERRARAVPVTLAGGAATTLDHGHVVIAAITSCTNTSNPSVMIGAGILALAVVSVLSGNRNFEGRIHAEVKLNYLASPPLCVAYALAGTMDVDIVDDPLGEDSDGNPVFLRDLWPSEHEVAQTIEQAVRSDMFRKSYGEVFDGDERWNSLAVPAGDRFAWAPASTYVRLPPYFEGMPLEPEPLADITGARALVMLGDSVTTDHISPAGSIRRDGPAGAYLQDHDVKPVDFNSYGSRRGNHEVMMRGTFANVRLRNLLAPGTEGGLTRHLPDGEQLSIYDAAMRYRQDGVPLVALGGKEYGSGSSRDWAAKGTLLLGVRAVIAESYERIHRSNLVGMGVLPLQFAIGDSAASLGLDGEEEFSISGVAGKLDAGELPREATVRAGEQEFTVRVRIDTPKEAEYFRHGGILQYVLRQLLTQTANDDHQGRAGARGSRGDHD